MPIKQKMLLPHSINPVFRADNWWGGADKSWADERQNEGGTDLEKPGVGLNISVVSLDKSCFKTFTVNTVSFWIRKWLLNHSHGIVTP